MIGRHGEHHIYRELFRSKAVLRCLAGAALIPLGTLVGGAPLPGPQPLSAGEALLLTSLAVNGLPIVAGAVRGLLAREINVDELVAIALLACLATGAYAEGAIVSAIMVLGSLVEEAVSDGARRSIRGLIEASPREAVLARDGGEIRVEIGAVRPGDLLVVRAGETVPVDGRVEAGGSSIDEASITGESVPVDRGVGDEVYAGTVCVDGFLRVRAERVGADSAMGRIVQLVEAAEGQPTDSGKIVDRYAGWFTPVILALAGLTWLVTGDLTRAITVLIVGCPCSFLLASPVSTVAAIGRAARAGILVKGGRPLERLAGCSGFFFDKTGTLTHGEPEVVEVRPHDGWSEAEVIGLAAAVEVGSRHPLAAAIVARAVVLGLAPAPAEAIRAELGRGIAGRVGGRRVEVVTSRRPDDRAVTCVDVVVDGRPAGTIGLLDRPRETAAATMRALRAEGIADLVILSGDQAPVVRRVAEAVGIDRYHAAQKPDDKLARIAAYGAGKVAYVGDGLNDAPALKAATTGIAMGLRGVEVALETADIVLMNDRLDRLPFLVRLGRRMARTIKAGILLSFAINLIALAASFLGLLTPILGAVTHNLGAILVVSLAASLRFTREA